MKHTAVEQRVRRTYTSRSSQTMRNSNLPTTQANRLKNAHSSWRRLRTYLYLQPFLKKKKMKSENETDTTTGKTCYYTREKPIQYNRFFFSGLSLEELHTKNPASPRFVVF